MKPWVNKHPESSLNKPSEAFVSGKEEMERGDQHYEAYKDPKQANNHLSLAINEYTKAYELNDSPYILAQMARVYMLNGQFDTAEKYIQKVLQRNPQDKEVIRNTLETQAFLQFH